MDMKEDGLIQQGSRGVGKSGIDVSDSTKVRLEQLGITPNQSAQAMAAIPEPVFDDLVKAVIVEALPPPL